jgi:hypothetical protein
LSSPSVFSIVVDDARSEDNAEGMDRLFTDAPPRKRSGTGWKPRDRDMPGPKCRTTLNPRATPAVVMDAIIAIETKACVLAIVFIAWQFCGCLWRAAVFVVVVGGWWLGRWGICPSP